MISESFVHDVLKSLHLEKINKAAYFLGGAYGDSGQLWEKRTPIDNSVLASFYSASKEDYEVLMKETTQAFVKWREVPAPKRGEMVRMIGNGFRKHKESLGALISLETGKLLQEGLGEVQEIIDICDFAVGLSRQLYGLTMHSERKQHRMYEQYHPIGVVGIISAFNFPAAVWSWNAMLALVCGDTCIWKPSEKASLTAVACMQIVKEALADEDVPAGILSLYLGGSEQGAWMSSDKRIPLVSATGSVAMGKKVNQVVAERFGKTLLELGGNNAIIVTENANLDLAIRAIVFGAVGTCGQRCTSTRRLIVHPDVYDEVVTRLKNAYAKLPIGSPLEKGILIGPLIDSMAVNAYQNAVNTSLKEGATLVYGGKVMNDNFVQPTILTVSGNTAMVRQETFAPILYVMKYNGQINDAIRLQNEVDQGLSSAIFCNRIQDMEYFLSSQGSDCGIANVNIGTSGAEIGGAFGGEKETGGGRESGSDAWKVYMRRQTNTINYSSDLPLAQGIEFDF
ncbi:MAG: aldehyde dehydrogenase family protein [Cytophagaceae bacterium]